MQFLYDIVSKHFRHYWHLYMHVFSDSLKKQMAKCYGVRYDSVPRYLFCSLVPSRVLVPLPLHSHTKIRDDIWSKFFGACLVKVSHLQTICEVLASTNL